MVTIPADVSEGQAWRAIPDPASQEMAMDAAMINFCGEGWKEVKVVAVSAIKTEREAGEEPTVSLNGISYRAGLWEAAHFANQQWAESCRRGLEKAQRVVCVSDGAPWVWAIVVMCYDPRCIEILDWWHAVQELWEMPFTLWSQDNQQSRDWAEEQKSLLWTGEPRQISRTLRSLCPRGEPLSDKIRQVIGYLFDHLWRMRYPEFRQAGCPIGSGSVESACKAVVQERMKQGGMRWSRDGAQAMLALRTLLLSQRWQDVWTSLEPPLEVARISGSTLLWLLCLEGTQNTLVALSGSINQIVPTALWARQSADQRRIGRLWSGISPAQAEDLGTTQRVSVSSGGEEGNLRWAAIGGSWTLTRQLIYCGGFTKTERLP